MLRDHVDGIPTLIFHFDPFFGFALTFFHFSFLDDDFFLRRFYERYHTLAAIQLNAIACFEETTCAGDIHNARNPILSCADCTVCQQPYRASRQSSKVTTIWKIWSNLLTQSQARKEAQNIPSIQRPCKVQSKCHLFEFGTRHSPNGSHKHVQPQHQERPRR
jgi:hypothetical protein